MISDSVFFVLGATVTVALLIAAHVISVKVIKATFTSELAALEARLRSALDALKSKV